MTQTPYQKRKAKLAAQRLEETMATNDMIAQAARDAGNASLEAMKARHSDQPAFPEMAFDLEAIREAAVKRVERFTNYCVADLMIPRVSDEEERGFVLDLFASQDFESIKTYDVQIGECWSVDGLLAMAEAFLDRLRRLRVRNLPTPEELVHDLCARL